MFTFFFIYDFPLFYNVPLFSVNSAFCNKFIASFLLTKLIIPVPYPELFWSQYTSFGSQIQTPKFLKMLD